jgi:hypothetical protein
MNPDFNPYERHYASLSIKDLLDAREAAHMEFTRQANIVATAVGLYRIRSTDKDATHSIKAGHAAKMRGRLGARTLTNSVVRDWSWPCVLVFVREWLPLRKLRPEDVIPPFISLSDGRVIPVCTIEATLYDGSPAAETGPLTFSSNIVGGGYPVLTDVQGEEHVGSLACLVTDGDRYFALTNQHVAGLEGREVYTLVRGQRVRIGVAAGAALRKKAFSEVFPGFPGNGTLSNLDIGLIDVDDASLCTSQVFGLGVLGPLVDFNCASASLDWIGVDLVAHGAHSARLEGEVKALFYRYSTLNGTDFVSDFLIGGRGDAHLPTAPGDSGTLWCLDPGPTPAKTDPKKQKDTPAVDKAERFRPVAVQWGGQKVSRPGGSDYTQFALASSAAVACRELDVEIITDLNAEHTTYWGPVGHYKIAQLATGWVSSAGLRKFLTANLANLTYDPATIAKGSISNDATQFVPLADVPDVVWKTNINRSTAAARAQENWNHYVDIDLPGADGRTLSDFCGEPPRLAIADWIEFYTKAPLPSHARGRSNNMGALPFRVWQIFDAMVGYRRQGDAKSFLCAAGVLSHYIGDACQPLHSSMHSDGLDGASTGVHSVYEEMMVDKFAAELGARLDAFDPKTFKDGIGPVAGGYQAAQESVRLMRRTQQRIHPVDLCNRFTELGGGHGASVVTGLWTAFADETVACIADGTRTLAMLWDAAYATAGSDFKGEILQADLKVIYEKASFLPSLHLANLTASDYPVPGDSASAVRTAGDGGSAGRIKRKAKKTVTAKKTKKPVKRTKKARRKQSAGARR